MGVGESVDGEICLKRAWTERVGNAEEWDSPLNFSLYLL